MYLRFVLQAIDIDSHRKTGILDLESGGCDLATSHAAPE